MTKPAIAELLAMHNTMQRIRAFEERCLLYYKQGQLRGGLHLSIGQEAVAAGICGALRADDLMTTTHRGHGHCLAKGAPLQAMADEIVGRESGLCGGRGGSMHLADASLGMLGANAIVGAGIPIATGAALSAQVAQDDRVAVAIFGEGAAGQGVLHESMNLAALWKLPVIFVCENNLYAELTHISLHFNNPSLADYAKPYGIPGIKVDGNDAAEVRKVAEEAIALARAGKGPTFIECLTYRIHGHFAGDPQTYRTKEEVAEWQKRDPLLVSREAIVSEDESCAARLDEMRAAAEAEMLAAFERSFASNGPDPETLLENVYA